MLIRVVGVDRQSRSQTRNYELAGSARSLESRSCAGKAVLKIDLIPHRSRVAPAGVDGRHATHVTEGVHRGAHLSPYRKYFFRNYGSTYTSTEAILFYFFGGAGYPRN